MIPCRSLAVSALVLVACARGTAPSGPPAPLVVGSGRSAAPVDELEAPRARVLAAMDRGDLAEATRALAPMAERQDLPGAQAIARALSSPGRDGLFANVQPLKIAPPPPPVTATGPALQLAINRVKSPAGARESIERAVSGEYLASGGGDPFPDAAERVPAFAPLRLAEIPIRHYRASDRRWFVTYADRFVAIVHGENGALARLLDFGAWPPSMHGSAVEWGELRGDVLYFTANSPNGRFVAAIDLRDGRILWRSQDRAFAPAFAVGAEHVVAWALGQPGELVVFDRKSGAVLARRPTPEIVGEAHLYPEDGVVVAYASSQTMNGTDLRHEERLELRLPASKPAPAPPMPKAPVPVLAPATVAVRTDARLDAWSKLDRHRDSRAAVLALRPVLDAYPTNFAANVLAAASRVALGDARKKAADTLAASPPLKLSTDPRSARVAPIRRPRARSLRVTSRKAVTLDTFLSELPRPDESVLMPPAAVPEMLAGRRRDVDAGSIDGDRRVEVYKAPYNTSWVVVWDKDRTVGFFEIDADIRFANLSGDVLFFARLASGRYLLEARDVVTGDLYYQTPGINDQAFVIRDGYVVACAGDSSSVLLIEADTGRVASRVTENVGEPFLIFWKDGSIRAVTTSLALQLALLDSP